MLEATVATVFGGSGFIGRYVIKALARQGYTIRVPMRDPWKGGFLRTAGVVGQINPMPLSLHNHEAIAKAVEGASLVINLLGELAPSRRTGFEFLHAEVPGRIARAAAETGAARMIHISAIGADEQSASAYARSKAHGEAQVRAAFPEATILRPSIVFGPEDQFFNRFAKMAEILPALPLIGGGLTRFQPVYVADVADAVSRCVVDKATAGQTYELGGPEIYSFRQLMQKMLKEIDYKRALVTLPFGMANVQARFMEYLPGKPLTRDQVTLLKQDNIVSPGAKSLADLGITPTALDIVLPTYLDRFRKGGRFHGVTHGEKFFSES
jgi:NADH dehydrogenase